MGSKTKIEWTEATWNPVRGCSIVSEGCCNCYAMRMAHRSNRPGGAYEGLTRIGTHGPTWTGDVRFVPENLEIPLKVRKPTRWFVNSMSDLFHESLDEIQIGEIFAIMAMCPQHTFQVLTKRPERMQRILETARICFDYHEPLPNVWLGVSVEDQKTADERIPLLLQTPAALRWISAEPLLGPIDLEAWLDPTGFQCLDPDCLHWQRSFLTGAEQEEYERTEDRVNANGHIEQGDPICLDCGLVGTWTGYNKGLNWIVVGGESGPGARPVHPDWARSIRDQCVASAVPFFFKQWGEWLPRAFDPKAPSALWYSTGRLHAWADGESSLRVGKKAAGHLLDGREWHEYPQVQSAVEPAHSK